MKRLTILLALLLAALFVLAGCGTPANVEPGADAGADEEGDGVVDSAAELQDALEAAGLEVQPGEALREPLFETTAGSLMVGEAMIQLFEFADEATAGAAAGTVNATGTIIGTKTIDWVERPHFYRQGKLIVLYAGDDEAILSALQEALGEPFVVGESAFAPADE